MTKTPKAKPQAQTYDPEAMYSVRLKKPAVYGRITLAPAHDHTIKGKVLEAIKDCVLDAQPIAD